MAYHKSFKKYPQGFPLFTAMNVNSSDFFLFKNFFFHAAFLSEKYLHVDWKFLIKTFYWKTGSQFCTCLELLQFFSTIEGNLDYCLFSSVYNCLIWFWFEKVHHWNNDREDKLAVSGVT